MTFWPACVMTSPQGHEFARFWEKNRVFFCIQNGGFTMKNIGFTMTNLGLNCLNIKLNGGLTFVIFICSAPNCWYHQQTMEDMEIWWCSFDKWGLSISKCQLNDLRIRPQTMEQRKTCYFSSWHDKTSDVAVKHSNSATLRMITGKTYTILRSLYAQRSLVAYHVPSLPKNISLSAAHRDLATQVQSVTPCHPSPLLKATNLEKHMMTIWWSICLPPMGQNMSNSQNGQ